MGGGINTEPDVAITCCCAIGKILLEVKGIEQAPPVSATRPAVRCNTAKLLDSHEFPVFIWFYLLVFIFTCFGINFGTNLAQPENATIPFCCYIITITMR